MKEKVPNPYNDKTSFSPLLSHVEKLLTKSQVREFINNEAPGGSTPSQYQLPNNATDLQDLIEYRDMNFVMGNIFKACYRSGNCSHSMLLP